MSIVQAWGGYYIIFDMLCKYYVAKSSEEQKKKMKNIKNMMRRKEK
jgi:hypothetical protein